MPSQLPEIPKQDFLKCMQTDIFWITNCIAVGPYPEAEKQPLFKQSKITHIVNVSEYKNEWDKQVPTIEIAWLPIVDLKKIPRPLVVECLKIIHSFLQSPNAKVVIVGGGGEGLPLILGNN